MSYTDDDYLGNHGSPSRTAAMIDESPQMAELRRELASARSMWASTATALTEARAEISKLRQAGERWERDKLERERLIRAGFELANLRATEYQDQSADEAMAELIAQECP